MRKAKQSTAKNVMVLMVDSTDHVTGKTGLTLTITASKDGAAFASITPTVTERGSGWYNLALTTAHTNTLGDLALHITGTAADPADMVLLVEAGSTDADVSTRSTFAGGAVASVTGAVGSVTGLNPALLDVAVSTRSTFAGGAVASVTAAVTLPSIPANWITAAGINAAALNGKGDWNVGKTGYSLTVTPPTAVQVRQEIDSNSTKLDAAISTRMATFTYTAPPTAAAIRTEIDSNSTKLDVAVGTRLATASYSAPPTVSAIRTEIDINSTKLDVAVGTRMATFSYTAPPTAAAIRAEIDANSTKLDATVSSRMATFTYTAPDNATITTINGKLPALVGGRVDASVGAMAANVLTGAAISVGALNGKGNWNIGKTGYTLTVSPPTASVVADAVWGKVL